MASESHEEQAVGGDLPTDLSDWLDEQAATLGVDREELVVQILSSYHAAATLDDDQLDPSDLLDVDAEAVVDLEAAVAEELEDHLEETVDERVEERLDDALSARVDELVAERVEAELDERLADAVADQVEAPLAELDEEFQAKIQDVRERVVQVKQETDAKAPAEHTHDELQRIDTIAATVQKLGTDLEGFREEIEERLDESDEARESIDSRLDDAEDKLKRVAWVVSDLKDETSGRDAHEQAVARIKRAAAQEGVSTADCENCGGTAHVGLLTEPECPHCQATVSDVRPEGGFIRTKARLVTAAQLEAGERGDDA